MCGVLSTVAVAYLLRHLPGIRQIVASRDADFVGFVTYGLAISLVASAARAMRRRDTVILILAATIIWVVFIEVRQLAAMLRFLVLSSGITLGILAADGLASGTRWPSRAVWGVFLPGVLGGAAGTIYYALAGLSGGLPGAMSDLVALGSASGFGLGLAVGLGLWAGGELLRWMSREGS